MKDNNDVIEDFKPRKDPERIEPEMQSDTDFSDTEQKKIAQMICSQVEADINNMIDWVDSRKKCFEHYDAQKPSVIENLDKDDWMSDRNMGLCPAVCDTYHSTLLATSYNVDMIHFKWHEEAIDLKTKNLEKFTKWGLGPAESSCFQDISAFIKNKIVYGVSYLKVRWEVKHKYVDRRIPVYAQEGQFIKYDIKTEQVAVERGLIENIDDVADLIYPVEGKTLQDKDHITQRIHKTAAQFLREAKKKEHLNVDDNFIKGMKKTLFDRRTSLVTEANRDIMGLKSSDEVTDDHLNYFNICYYEWYGLIDKEGGNEEEYRITVEPITKTFLSGKPLRKITRTGKRPFVGGGFIQNPGMVQGKALTELIGDLCSFFNAQMNQKVDYQTIINCPIFFYQPSEAFKKQEYEFTPGKGYPTSDANSIVFPKWGGSVGWANEDMHMILEMVERMTGAASYFLTQQSKQSTATRDAIVNEKSETRFGLWVKSLTEEIGEAITMWLGMYQSWAPSDIAERAIGKDGKKLFDNLSAETLMGSYSAYISPDIIAGSKTLEKQIALWAFENLSQSFWFNPQINPRGSYDLTVEAARKVGFDSIQDYMPKRPEIDPALNEDAEDIFIRIKSGEKVELSPTINPAMMMESLNLIYQEKGDEIDPEYRPNFSMYMTKLMQAMMQQQREAQIEQMSNQIAAQTIDLQNRGAQITPEMAQNVAQTPQQGGMV